MRILFVGPVPPPMTGQALACRVILDEIEPLDRVDLIDLSKRDFRQGFTSGTRALEVAGILWRVFAHRWHADVIYLTISESRAGNLKDLCIYALCAGRWRRLVIHLLGGANMRKMLQDDHGVAARLNRWFVRRLGGVVVEGNTQASLYRPIVEGSRIHVVPNFAEDSLLTTPERIDEKFSRTAPLRVLFLSNLLPGKGHDELVAAFKTLDADTRSSIEVDFAGGFESEAQRSTFLSTIAGTSQIRYHGAVGGQQKRALLDGAHVFCLPTYYPYEGQPISLIEAYAAGCAVITTNHSGIRDIFRPDENGIEVVKRSVPDLAEAIRAAVRTPDRLRRMARVNLETALARHRRSDYAGRIAGIIHDVARRR